MHESLHTRLSEVVGAYNVSYILNDNNDFSVTGYKVMQNHSGSDLLHCAKIMYNGKIKLVYIAGETKPLSQIITRLGINEINAIIFNLIQRVIVIKANGFFRADNLELDYNKIFVDTSDYSVHLIYYPLSGGSSSKRTSFENEIRVNLINLFKKFPVFNAPQFNRLCNDLSDVSLSLEDILKKLQENINSPGKKPEEHMPQPVMTIASINSPVQSILKIHHPEFLIGKNPNLVNGVISHNPAISRVHCKISYISGKYFITDMNSANGTYINHQRLEQRQTVQIHSGDYLRLANSDFIISF